MRRRILGRTGIEVSELGFGSLFTSSLGPGFETSRRAVHRAIDLGINYFDTAPAYANSEEVLGRILAEIDAPLIVSTKLGGRPQPFDPQNPKQLRDSVEDSLRLLHRDVIDILFIHEPDRPLQYNWWTDPQGGERPGHRGAGRSQAARRHSLHRPGRHDRDRNGPPRPLEPLRRGADRIQLQRAVPRSGRRGAAERARAQHGHRPRLGPATRRAGSPL